MKLPTWREFFSSFKFAFGYERCAACNIVLDPDEMFFCSRCRKELPTAMIVDSRDNIVANRLRCHLSAKWFKAPYEIYSAISCYRYYSDSPIADLIHDFKYRGHYAKAIDFGHEIGRMMLKLNMHRDYDFLVPVPIHPKRRAQRGYNQTEYIAQGISEETSLPVNTEILRRSVYAVSQTKKDTFERVLNVDGNFELIAQPEHLAGVRLLLVDDVLTTGSTTHQCCLQLYQIPYVRLGVATVAYVLAHHWMD